MSTREEVERAYLAAVEVVERPELQHLNPYQLAGHIRRAQLAHLEELNEPEVVRTGLKAYDLPRLVDPEAMRAAEDHPEDAVIGDEEQKAAFEAGHASFQAGQERSAGGHHGRSRLGRAHAAGWDAGKRETEA